MCSVCPEGSTSAAGALSADACECEALRYKDPESGQCALCSELESAAANGFGGSGGGGGGGTNCSQPGSTLASLKVRPGFWRAGNTSRRVRKCVLHAASCIGGEVGVQCGVGHAGPLCDICKENYHGGRGRACEECVGSVGVALAMPVFGCILALACVVLALVRCRHRRGQMVRAVLSGARDMVDAADSSAVASGESECH